MMPPPVGAMPTTPAGASSSSSAAAAGAVVASSSDPSALLDTLDLYDRVHPRPGGGGGASAVRPKSGSGSSQLKQQQQQQQRFDPIDFLNRHYQTESHLVNSLPPLRRTVSERIAHLNDSISGTIQRQADLASATTLDVARAKSNVVELHRRIKTVQSKALLSERAVLEITRDMKRLDYAKRHLQRTITALKRLHMLTHAVEQLRLAASARPHPDYRGAANLVDATRLLLGHFDRYVHKVPKIRDVRDKVEGIERELERGAVHGFRVVGFGEAAAADMEARQRKAKGDEGDGGGAAKDADEDSSKKKKKEPTTTTTYAPPPPMPPAVLSDATLLVDALGPPTRKSFVVTFCSEHLGPYWNLFHPTPHSAGPESNAAAAPAKPSFKIKLGSDSAGAGSGGGGGDGERPPYSLDQVERRFAWFRRTLRESIEEKFAGVFPKHWNLHYEVTNMFLEKTRDHFLALLDGPAKDRDSGNVTVLLKALQKSILFEKEMTVWLQRDFGTVFVDPSVAGGDASASVLGEDGEALEFDDSGRAVAAGSAEGIRIKYERKMKRNQRGAKKGGAGGGGGGDFFSDRDDGAEEPESDDVARAAEEVVPVRPLLGVSSSAFDNYMSPYISLEEQNMDEQLVEATSDVAVDSRGELPVFTSSTNLFVYIKNSIARCTALTRGKTFHLLCQAYQDTLRKYATVLEGKLPPASAGPTGGVGGLSLAGVGGPAAFGSVPTFGKSSADAERSSSVPSSTYRIPPGEEVTVCHVIDTCEYCADTVEALEDSIRDRIDAEYEDRVDMSGEQEAFHDVTARGIRVLVSGLEHRTEGALKEMSGTNWGAIDVVGEESAYVRSMHDAIQPFVETVQGLIPQSYFRSFCDKFAMAFTMSYYNALVRLKRVSEAGTQQLLLDVYNLKTLLLKLPVMQKDSASSTSGPSSASAPRSAGSTIPPAMYTKMVKKQFAKIEILLKLVGTPPDLLIDVFKAQWSGGSALDLQTVMNLKGMKRNEQTAMLERFGVDSATALRGASVGASGPTMTEHVQALQDKGSDFSAKVNDDLRNMRQKVDDFRRAFR